MQNVESTNNTACLQLVFRIHANQPIRKACDERTGYAGVNESDNFGPNVIWTRLHQSTIARVVHPNVAKYVPDNKLAPSIVETKCGHFNWIDRKSTRLNSSH